MASQYFKVLVDVGLDPMAEDKAQGKPADVATACGNWEVLQWYEKKTDKEKGAVSEQAAVLGPSFASYMDQVKQLDMSSFFGP